MTIQEIKTKLESLRQKLPEYTDEMKSLADGWDKELVRIEQIEEVLKHPVIKEMVVDYLRKIETINYSLSNERKMKESDRQSLFADKEALQFFLDIFDIEETKKSLYRSIDSELKE